MQLPDQISERLKSRTNTRFSDCDIGLSNKILFNGTAQLDTGLQWPHVHVEKVHAPWHTKGSHGRAFGYRGKKRATDKLSFERHT